MPLFFNLSALVAVCILSWLYWVGVDSSYFWFYPWYDMPLHMLGGLVLGLWSMAIAARKHFMPRQALLLAAAIVLPVLLAWEVWEYVVGLTGQLPDYWLDTLQDICNGAFGALAGWIIYVLTKRI